MEAKYAWPKDNLLDKVKLKMYVHSDYYMHTYKQVPGGQHPLHAYLQINRV